MSEDLKEAISEGSMDRVIFLLNAGVNVNRPFLDGMPPLNYAISIHQEDIAHTLLKNGASVSQPDEFRLDECRRCPMHYAAACNLMDMVHLLVSFGASSNILDFGNSNPLHHAAFNGNVEIVEYFLHNGVDINHQSKSGRTAIWKASQNGQEEIVQYLLASGANINMQNKVGATMLFDTVKQNRLELLGNLINHGADLNLKDIEGNTVLHSASSIGKTEAIELLLSPGTLDINEGNEYGNTALHNSSMHDHVEATICLLNHKADYNLLNRNAQSSLYLTMLHRNIKCTVILHDCGARLTRKELDLIIDFEAKKCPQREVFYQWAFQYFHTPKKLSTLAISVIRNHLVLPIEHCKSVLPLPKFLQDELTMSRYKQITERIYQNEQ